MESTHQMRRRAPLHYQARADNARYAAYLLSHFADTEATKAKEAITYGGTPSIALNEVFRREAAISLELMLKAIIALRIERRASGRGLTSIPFTHNVPALWKDAELPTLDKEGRLALLYLKQVLTWSGRYPAPKDDAAAIHEESEIEAVREDRRTPEGFRFRKPILFGWKEFDRLYEMAAKVFWNLHER